MKIEEEHKECKRDNWLTSALSETVAKPTE